MKRNRRRRRDPRAAYKSLAAVVLIIGMAVMMGFMTTRFVIYPLFIEEESTESSETENDTEKDESGKETSGSIKESSIKERLAEKLSDIIFGRDKKENKDASAEKDERSGGKAEEEETRDMSAKDTAAYAPDSDGEGGGKGFSIQFGSFSDKASAQKLASELERSGIEAQIIKKDDSYKVTGSVFSTKEAALSEKSRLVMLDENKYEDIFITERDLL